MLVPTPFFAFMRLNKPPEADKPRYNDDMEVFAEDAFNDFISLTFALLCALGGQHYLVCIDAIGTILIAIYILVTWLWMGVAQLSKWKAATQQRRQLYRAFFRRYYRENPSTLSN